MAQPILPDEICSFIQDMACRKVHNGTSSNYGLMICIDIDFAKKIEGDIERTLESWIVSSLDKARRAVDKDNAWHSVSVVQWDQEVVDEDEEYVERRNAYRVVVKFVRMREDMWPLFSYNGPVVQVSPECVLGHFDTPPEFVRSIGVSGVSDTVLRDEWAETIMVTFSNFTCPGKGFMRHPMWIYRISNPPMKTTEVSYRYGWVDYPGDRFKDDV